MDALGPYYFTETKASVHLLELAEEQGLIEESAHPGLRRDAALMAEALAHLFEFLQTWTRLREAGISDSDLGKAVMRNRNEEVLTDT